MPSVPDTQHAQRQGMEALFGTIAQRYDRFNQVVSWTLDRRWRHRALARALEGKPANTCRVLDVCTGTGELALGCAAALNGTSRVVGLDASDTMLHLAERKARARGMRVSWLRGDAHDLPCADDSFDVVLIGFSTRNVPDLRQACAEMWRVLRPQGRLVILETGKPQTWPMRLLYYTYMTTLMPLIGLLLCGRLWPFRYLRRSIIRFLQPRAFVALLKETGFVAAEHQPLHRGLADLFIAVKGPCSL